MAVDCNNNVLNVGDTVQIVDPEYPDNGKYGEITNISSQASIMVAIPFGDPVPVEKTFAGYQIQKQK